MPSEDTWLGWVIAWMINAGWFALAIYMGDLILGVGAFIYTAVLIVWALPGAGSGDE
jgi:hypothetical protein